MAREKLFESAARSTGDLAGVFEHDGETGHFYLYAPQAPQGRKTLAALHVMSGPPSLDDGVVKIRWDSAETIVGLFIGSQLWAAFDSTSGVGYAGDYAAGVAPHLPPRVSAALLGR